MNNKSKVLFSSFKKEDLDFDEAVLNANKVWRKAFNCEYDAGECLRYSNNFEDSVMIGRIDNKPVCAAIIEYWNDKKLALISCIGAYPEKCGYGSLLMKNIIKNLKTSKITEVYLKIIRDKKAIRLEKFFSKFGFAKVNEDILFDLDRNLNLDRNFNLNLNLNLNHNLNLDLDTEYAMSRKLDLDLDFS
jgi:N-acetylglutamate synthase-like GNAT family acetyltransferase